MSRQHRSGGRRRRGAAGLSARLDQALADLPRDIFLRNIIR